MDAVIVIPCYNEEPRFKTEAFIEGADALPGVRFVLVDDGSRDGTSALLETVRKERPGRFEILSLRINRGKAEAVRRGVLRALEWRPAFVGYLDADLSTPIRSIPLFFDAFRRQPAVQMVLGIRLMSLGRTIIRNPFRHYAGRMIATGISAVTGLGVYDSQCGAKLFRVTDDLRMIFQTPFVSQWLFDAEILLRFKNFFSVRTIEDVNRVFYELPLPEWRDVKGSKLSLHDAILVPSDLFRIWSTYRLNEKVHQAP